MTTVTGFARLAAFEAAKRDTKARFYDQWQAMCADMQGELDEIDRRYWAGEQEPIAPAPLKKAA